MSDNLQKAQEYRKSAEMHLASVKSSLRTFFVTGVFVIAAVIVYIIIALAWYANKKDVSANGIGISARNEGIELRSYGTTGVHDDVLIEQLGTAGEKGFWYSAGEGGKLDTTRSTPSVNWLLTDESNIGNYSATSVDWTSEDVKRTDYAIEPGSEGNISFCIVPKVSGDITVKLSLDMIPYYVSEKKFHEIPSDDFVTDELYGHILYSLLDGEGENTLQWINDRVFEIEIPNAVIDQEYPYTIHWSWTQIFGEIILNDLDTYLNGREPIYSEYNNGSDIRDSIVADMMAKPQKYFYSSLTRSPLTKDYPEVKCIPVIHENSTEQLLIDGKADVIQAFVDLSSYYNQADQYIGKNVDCIRVSLVAELSNVEK